MFLSLFSLRPLETGKQKNRDETTLEIDRRIFKIPIQDLVNSSHQFHNIQGKKRLYSCKMQHDFLFLRDEPL